MPMVTILLCSAGAREAESGHGSFFLRVGKGKSARSEGNVLFIWGDCQVLNAKTCRCAWVKRSHGHFNDSVRRGQKKEELGYLAETWVYAVKGNLLWKPGVLRSWRPGPHTSARSCFYRAGFLLEPLLSLSLFGTPLMGCRCPIWLEARSRYICPSCFYSKNTCKSLSLVRFTTHLKLWNFGPGGRGACHHPPS